MPLQQLLPNVFHWTDTCNVYVIKDGDSALLVDLGDGSVLDQLKSIGVERVEWVLFTHHHREQCQGAARLKTLGAKIAAPAGERSLFERPADFRKMAPTLNDAMSVYGASYVRPPVEPIKIDRAFGRMDDFTWRGREIWCVEAKGNSPGGMAYLIRHEGRFVAFSGDVILDGAKLHNYFDSEWDYGFAAGIYALYGSASLLEAYDPVLLLPSHGPVIREPVKQLRLHKQKLRKLAKLVLRGYEINTFAEGDQDTVSKPTSVPHVFQVTKHLFKFKGPNFWPNFNLLLADSGHGLLIDCGLFEEPFLDHSIQLMKERLGLKQIDAVIVTHMHGDHMLEATHVKEKWRAQIWTMDRVADYCRRPQRYDYSAMIESYGKKNADGSPLTAVAIDRVLAEGQTLEWEGYTLTADWMPGQTEFALCLHGEIDGKTVAFTGDNIFASTTDPTQSGHEAVVARNSCMMEEGYLYAANYLHGIAPDLIMGGHSWVMDKPAELIERLRNWAMEMRQAFVDLSVEGDYRLMFDPYWVRAEPYRTTAAAGSSAEVALLLRNFRDRPVSFRVQVLCPEGVSVEPGALEVKVEAESVARPIPLRLRVGPQTGEGVKIVAFDVTVDGQRYGAWFDMMLEVVKPAR
jgi:glyoxylase-like metal-dependent hydrolase (beta-lactamase superfamily II)